MKLKVFNAKGEVTREAELDPLVFGVTPKEDVIHGVIVALQANRRAGTAHTRTRGEVRGGGKKPWAQKGTGRARQGSTRSPIWKGGGVVFGPRNDRDYTQKINKKVARLAVRMCLSDKVSQERIVLVDALPSAAQKTKSARLLFTALKIPLARRRAAMVIAPDKGKDDAFRAFRNIPSVYATRRNAFSVLDILTYPYIVTTPEILEQIAVVYRRGLQTTKTV